MPFSNEEILGFLKESVGEENLIQVSEPDGILTIEVEKSKLILMVQEKHGEQIKKNYPIVVMNIYVDI
jgi:hypothetical protein